MEFSNPYSVFQGVRLRELNGFRGTSIHLISPLYTHTDIHIHIETYIAVSNGCECCSVRKRPFIDDAVSGFRELGAVAVEHGGDVTPPMAVSFCKVCHELYNSLLLLSLPHF